MRTVAERSGLRLAIAARCDGLPPHIDRLPAWSLTAKKSAHQVRTIAVDRRHNLVLCHSTMTQRSAIVTAARSRTGSRSQVETDRALRDALRAQANASRPFLLPARAARLPVVSVAGCTPACGPTGWPAGEMPPTQALAGLQGMH